MTIKRMTFLQELLAFIGLQGRLHLEWISSAEAQKFVEVVTGFTEKMRALGPSPLATVQQVNRVPVEMPFPGAAQKAGAPVSAQISLVEEAAAR